MSNKPSSGMSLADQVMRPTLLSITRITLSSTSTLLSALLANGNTTPPYNNTNNLNNPQGAIIPNLNPATGLPYAAPYIDEQIAGIAFVGVGGTATIDIGINNAASTGLGTLSVPNTVQPGANQMPINQSVALVMYLKGAGQVDVYQFG